MGLDISVFGIKPKNSKFEEMKSIYDSCIKLKISIPKEVDDYFGDADFNDHGIATDNFASPALEEYYEYELFAGYILDLDKIDKDIRKIVFNMSY